MADTTIKMSRSDALTVVKRSIELGKLDNALAIIDSLINQEKEIEKEDGSNG